MEFELRSRLERAVTDHVFPGAVFGVIKSDGSRTFIPIGRFTYEATSQVVTADTMYDVASITKSVPVGLLTLLFIEKGLLKLDDRIIDYVPEIQIKGAEKALIRHLLTYTYVLQKNPDPNFSYENLKAKDIFDFLYKREFEFLPGTHYQYSNAPANLLGLVLERISQEKLYALAQKLILEPLEMKNSMFHPSDVKAIPPTEITSWRGEIRGEVHDETAFILQREGFDSGCAGLFSTVGDLLNVAETILEKGSFRGKKVFDGETISLMTTNALSDIGQWSGIGWELNQPRFMGENVHENTIGKTGFTGAYCVIDTYREIGFALFSNRTYPKRTDPAGFIEVRRDLSDIILKSL